MPKILIADDDADMRDWLAQVLRDAGYKVDTQPDGEGLMATLGLGLVDLALIDYHLPAKSGLTLVREIRAAKSTVPVVILTADQSQQLAVECFRAGANDFVAKPVDPDYLKIVVDRALSLASKSLKNAAFRALRYAYHKPACKFHQDPQSCDCGLKELFQDVQDFN